MVIGRAKAYAFAAALWQEGFVNLVK